MATAVVLSSSVNKTKVYSDYITQIMAVNYTCTLILRGWNCNWPCIYLSNQLQFLGKESIYSQLLSWEGNYSETQLQFQLM